MDNYILISKINIETEQTLRLMQLFKCNNHAPDMPRIESWGANGSNSYITCKYCGQVLAKTSCVLQERHDVEKYWKIEEAAIWDCVKIK